MTRLATILLLMMFCTPTWAQPQGDRIALVIGNSDYSGDLQDLVNAEKDARLISSKLRAAGFEVEEIHDVDKIEAIEAIDRLHRRLQSAGPEAAGLFYFAGHGLQSDGVNYLMPVDAGARQANEIALHGVAIDEVLFAMLQTNSQFTFVVVDACRPNRVAEGLRRNSASGFQDIDTRLMRKDRDILIAYSTGLGEVAFDGNEDFSPYARALADNIETPGVPVEIMFRNVRRQLARDGTQRSWESSGMLNPFSFHGSPDEPDQAPAAPLPPGRIGLVGDFGWLPTSLSVDGYVPAQRYLANGMVPIALREVSPAKSEIVFFNLDSFYEGNATRPSNSSNVLTQIGTGNEPASFTLVFGQALAKVRFQLPALIAKTESGITFPAWRATAISAAGSEIAVVDQEMVRSFVDVPERIFELHSNGDDAIVAVRFDSDPRLNGIPFTAFSTILIESIWVQAMP